MIKESREKKKVQHPITFIMPKALNNIFISDWDDQNILRKKKKRVHDGKKCYKILINIDLLQANRNSRTSFKQCLILKTAELSFTYMHTSHIGKT